LTETVQIAEPPYQAMAKNIETYSKTMPLTENLLMPCCAGRFCSAEDRVVMLPELKVVMLPAFKVVMLPDFKVVMLPDFKVVMLPAKAFVEIAVIRMVAQAKNFKRFIVSLLVNELFTGSGGRLVRMLLKA